MSPKGYIETSVISLLTARPSRDLIVAAMQEATCEWWETKRQEYDCYAGRRPVMRTNPIIEEIHRIREAHAKRFNYDIDAIFADLRQRDAECRNLAKLRPVKPRPVPQVAEAPAPYAAKRPKAKAGKSQT